MKLHITKFGDHILRTPSKRLSVAEIQSDYVQQLIAEMRTWLTSKPEFGVGLAAPQVGVGLAISVIEIKPTPYRPVAEHASLVVINPEIVATYGRQHPMWEGCISYGGSLKDFPYAQAYRYKKVRLQYYDETGTQQTDDFDGLLAHVIQHETDHLNGILFVDKVRDPKTYMMKSEYIKQMRTKASAKTKH